MVKQKKHPFYIPKMDFSTLKDPLSDEEYTELEAKIEQDSSPEARRRFVAEVEAHPGCLSGWDASISFSEYARRVKAGEHDNFFFVPSLDGMNLDKTFTPEEAEAAMAKMDVHETGEELRAFVAAVKADPGRLASWDMPMSFNEFARRVEAGECD